MAYIGLEEQHNNSKDHANKRKAFENAVIEKAAREQAEADASFLVNLSYDDKKNSMN